MATINAVPHPHRLSKKTDNEYYLTPDYREPIDEAGIVKRLQDKGIATGNVDGLTFLKLCMDEAVQAAAEGHVVNLHTIRLALGIKGVVTKEDLGKTTSAEEVNVYLNSNVTEKGKKRLKDLKVSVYEQPAAVGPAVQSIQCPLTKQEAVVKAGQSVLIQGKRLTVKGEQSQLGVFFTSVDDPELQYQIPKEQLYPNKPSQLLFILPKEIPAGRYTVSVVTASTRWSSYLLKEPRTGYYPWEVTVEEPEGSPTR